MIESIKTDLMHDAYIKDVTMNVMLCYITLYNNAIQESFQDWGINENITTCHESVEF